MATVEMLRSRVDRYMNRINPALVVAVILEREVFVDGTRHLTVAYLGGEKGYRYIKVGRPKHDGEDLRVMLKSVVEDARRGVEVNEIKTRLFKGSYDPPALTA